MNFKELTEIELLQENVFRNIFGNDELELEARQQAKKLSVTREFDARYKRFKKQKLNKNLARANFCDFKEKDFDVICTGSWIANEQGIFKQVANYQTGEIDVKEASRMMVVPSATYKNMENDIEKVELSFFVRGQWQKRVIEKSYLACKNKIISLANYGFDVNSLNAKDLVSYFHDVLTLNDDSIIPHYASVSRMGWVKDSFMPYDNNIRFDGESEFFDLFKSIHEKGEIWKWIKFMKPLRKNKIFRVMMSASFASVLLERLQCLPFVFHLWGGTGTGKSVALMASMSIWGDPRMGKLTKTMNMTQNSMMATAGFIYSLPFGGDELQTIKTKGNNYDELIMKVTEGIDRGRMTFSNVNTTKTWRNVFIFTGEEPCTRSASGGGTKNRVVEVECTEKILENGNKVVSFINDNYGTAGKHFISCIKSEDLEKQYSEIYQNITQKIETTEKQAMALSAILLADRMASKHIFQDDPLKIEDIRKFAFTTKEVDVSERAYEYVQGLLAENVGYFQPYGAKSWGRRYEKHIFINKKVLCEQMEQAGFDFDACKKNWVKKGYLELSSSGKYAHCRRIDEINSYYIKLLNDTEELD